MKLLKCDCFVKCDLPFCNNIAKFVIPKKGFLNKKMHICEDCAREIYHELAKQQIPKSIQGPFKSVKKVRKKYEER